MVEKYLSEVYEAKQYPYQGRNLFELPENYFYVDCHNKNYLSAYFSYRKSVISTIEATSFTSSDLRPDLESSKTQLYFFFDLLKEQIEKDNFEIFDKFCAKFEVKKKFYAQYDQNFSPLKQFGYADTLSYINFAKCLCIAFEKTGCLGYLSTLIKCSDALCSITISFPDTEELLVVLKKEIEYVHNIK